MTTRTQIRQYRYPLANLDKIVQRQLNAHRAGHGQQVQNRVGGTTQGNHHGDGVLERLPGHDVRGLDVLLQQIQHRCPGGATVLRLGIGHRILGRTARQAHTHGFNGRRHGVGSVHATAGAWAGNGGFLDLLHLDQIQISAGMGTHRLKHRDYVSVVFPWLDRAAVDKD